MLAILGFIGELLSSNGVKLVICNVFSGTCVLWNEASGLLTAVKMNARDQSYCSVVVFEVENRLGSRETPGRSRKIAWGQCSM